MLAACAEIFRAVPAVQSVTVSPDSLVIHADGDTIVVGSQPAPGWLSLATPVAIEPRPAQRRDALFHTREDSPLRLFLTGGDLWARVDLQSPTAAESALAILLGQPPPPTRVEPGPLLERSRFVAQAAPGLGGWLLVDPASPGARAMVAQLRRGRLAVFLAVHQLDTHQLNDALVDAILTLNARLTVARLVPMDGLGLVAFASLAPEGPDALDAALRAIQEDAALVAQALVSPADDPRALLPMLRDFTRLSQAEAGISDAQVAQGILNQAAGLPVPEALAAVEGMTSVLEALAELLLETIPGLASSGRLVMQIGLTTAAEGARPLDEIWEVAETYLREASAGATL